MSITATPSAATVTAGAPYNYSVVTTNNGPDALASDSTQGGFKPQVQKAQHDAA
jgi:hypothetical protein